jgi:predicted RNA-binding protein YlxR (DUF448 family)
MITQNITMPFTDIVAGLRKQSAVPGKQARRQQAAPKLGRRKCIATGICGDPPDMLRFVLGPGKVLVPDIDGRLPGRGFWVRCERSCLVRAVSRGIFARAARNALHVTPSLADDVALLLRRRALQGLGLAHRAGAVFFDADIGAMAGAGAVPRPWAGLLVAHDAGDEGKVALRTLTLQGRADIPLITLFSRNELDLALGRTNVIHAALSPGGTGVRFLKDVARLAAVQDMSAETSSQMSERPE